MSVQHHNNVSLTEVLVVVDEVGQLPLPVDGLARRAHGVGERAGAATEDANFAHLKLGQSSYKLFTINLNLALVSLLT